MAPADPVRPSVLKRNTVELFAHLGIPPYGILAGEAAWKIVRMERHQENSKFLNGLIHLNKFKNS